MSIPIFHALKCLLPNFYLINMFSRNIWYGLAIAVAGNRIQTMYLKNKFNNVVPFMKFNWDLLSIVLLFYIFQVVFIKVGISFDFIFQWFYCSSFSSATDFLLSITIKYFFSMASTEYVSNCDMVGSHY